VQEMNEDNISVGQGRIHLTLREAESGKETYFTIKRTTPMMLIFAAFCHKKNLPPRSFCFVLEGGRVLSSSDTADSLEILESKCLISVSLSEPSFSPPLAPPPPPPPALTESSVVSSDLPVTIKVISDDREILFKIKRVSTSFPTSSSPSPPSSSSPTSPSPLSPSPYLSFPANPVFFHFCHSPRQCGASFKPFTQKWKGTLVFIGSCSKVTSCLMTTLQTQGD